MGRLAMTRRFHLAAAVACLALAGAPTAGHAATISAWGSCYVAEYSYPNSAPGCRVNFQMATLQDASAASQVASAESGTAFIKSEAGGENYTAQGMANGAGRASVGNLGVYATSFIAGKTRPNGGVAVDAQALAMASFSDEIRVHSLPTDGTIDLVGLFDVAQILGTYNHMDSGFNGASGSLRLMAEISANGVLERRETCLNCATGFDPLQPGSNAFHLAVPVDDPTLKATGLIHLSAHLVAETKALMWGAGGNSADSTVDAWHSLHVHIDAADPGLVFTSASGATYVEPALPVPEPGTLLLTALGLATLPWAARRGRPTFTALAPA